MRKSTKLLLTAGALFAFVTGGGVLALARGNVTCPKCGSAANREVIQETTATQHTFLYVCTHYGCEHFYPNNGWTETSAHTFVGDSCKKTCSECSYTAMVHTRGDRQNVQAATCGKKGYTGDVFCTECDTLIEKGHFTPATGEHNYKLKNYKAATCTKDGYTGDMICTVCGDVKSHGEVIPATGKHNYEPKNPKAATCQREGYTGDQVCSECGDTIRGQKTSKLDHTPGTVTVKWPTAPTLSNGTYTAKVSVTVRCTACGADIRFSDVTTNLQGTTPATCTEKATAAFSLDTTLTFDRTNNINWNVSIPVSDTKTYSVGEEPDHTYQVKWTWADSTDGSDPTAAAALTCALCDLNTTADVSIAKGVYTAPTCSAAGSQEYIATATYNGKTVGTDTKTVSIPATGEHAYTVGGWTLFDSPAGTGNFYKGTARIYCRNTDCSYYLTSYQTVEVTPTISESISPTCTQKGSKTYLFTAKLPGDPAIENNPCTKVVEIPATGHNYGENPKPVMAWDFSGANPTATATFTCETCKEPKVVNIASSDIGHVYQTSCTDEDHDLYTATFTFQGKEYVKTHTVLHPGTTPGHAYIGKWTWAEDPADGATLTLTCSKCSKVETFPVSATKKVTTPATCTTAGEEVYSVSYTYTNPYTNAATPYSDSKTVKLDPLGHDHTGTVTVAFDDDTCQTATATISCIRCSDTVTKPAVVTSVVTKPATCTAPGETTYTAAYGDVSTSKTVANIPALGHHFTNTRYNGDSTCEGEGTQTSVCDRCGATDTQTVPGSAGCTLHKVETAQVCPICGKVNGTAALNAVSAAADTSASTYGYRLVVRAGTLPNGRKVLTVAFLNAEGQAISLNGTQKIRISLAELNAQLGEDGAQGFAHTLTDLNTANGATGSVSFAVENGTLILNAAFHNSTASVLLVD